MENFDSLLSTSAKLLIKVKMRDNTILEEQKLQNTTFLNLQSELESDEAKKTFWINIYNSYFQILSNQKKINQNTIFKNKHIIIAQNRFSLDDIEHGILRRYRLKFFFGYLSNFYVSTLIKKLAVKKRDYRIHFALNCGVKSCPPISFYTLTKIDDQLNEAMFSFILAETSIDMNNKVVKTSRLLHWYKADFGGSIGIKLVLQKILELDLKTYKLSFTNYDYETHLENFTNE